MSLSNIDGTRAHDFNHAVAHDFSNSVPNTQLVVYCHNCGHVAFSTEMHLGTTLGSELFRIAQQDAKNPCIALNPVGPNTIFTVSKGIEK